MNISKVNLLSLFNTGTNQYVIPFFQRPYVWKVEDCENIYEDLTEIIDISKAGNKKEHFIGTIITKNSDSSTPMTAKFDLVDGQQRLTTFSVLIKALANSVKLEQPNAEHLFNNINSSLSFKDPYGETHYRIIHNRIDREYFNKIMESNPGTQLDEALGLNSITDSYRYFLNKFQTLSNEEILNFYISVLNQFPAISMVLDQNDDEQEIFDTINSLGVKLTTSELLKNLIFNDQATRQLYNSLWEDVFEQDEETVKFWNDKKTAGRVYRENIDILLFCYLIIKKEREVSLEHLFRDYKEWLKNKTPGQKIDFLEDLKQHAELFSNFPTGKELNNLKYNDIEKRFFHVIENLNVTTIYPLILLIYERVDVVSERLSCLTLLESFLVRRNICKMTTKNYNNLFISIIKSLNESKPQKTLQELRNIILGYKDDTSRFPTDDELKIAFSNSILNNQHSKLILYTIALYQVSTVLNDITSLSSSSFSVEHIMPKAWEQNWDAVESQEAKNNRNFKLMTLGNLTIITKNLNSKMRNSVWSEKRMILNQFSSLPLTTNYTPHPSWNEEYINIRANDLSNIALDIWRRE